jgi:nucleotide-binding universal stress UspA family protein
VTRAIAAPRIIAAVDGSPSSLRAALWAAAEAARRHGPIRLVHAVDTNSLAYGAWLAPGRAYFDLLRSDGERILAAAKADILGRYPDLDLTVALHMSGPVSALIEESDSALLLVIGACGTGGLTAILVGSAVVAVAEHARCPVAVIRGHHAAEAPPTAGPVVVGVDGSPLSDAAVATAFDEASWRRADLVAVHAWTEPFSYSRAVNTGSAAADEHEVLAERLAGWQEEYPDVTVRRVVERNTPVRSLLAHAVAAQLLVVGSRGHGGFAGMLLGSTSQSLIHHATCPMLVVRPVRRTS